MATLSGGPTQTATDPGPTAGIVPINTVGLAGEETGPPTCGTTPVTIGQICIEVNMAAGMGMIDVSSNTRANWIIRLAMIKNV